MAKPRHRPSTASPSASLAPGMFIVLAAILLDVALGARPATPQDSATARANDLIEKAVAERERAFAAIPRARGKGTYRETVADLRSGHTDRVTATFQMAYDYPKEFIQFRYRPGEGYQDCYARVVVSDGAQIYEGLFCEGISPHGLKAQMTKPLETGSLAPVLRFSFGSLTRAYGFIHLLGEGHTDLSFRDDGELKVVLGKEGGGDERAFWIDPSKNCQIVRYRRSTCLTEGAAIVLIDVRREWAQVGNRSFVKRFLLREVSRKDSQMFATREKELVLDTFEPDVSIPSDVFTVHSLGLTEGVTIQATDGDAAVAYARDPDFDRRRVETVVGELPVPKPRR